MSAVIRKPICMYNKPRAQEKMIAGHGVGGALQKIVHIPAAGYTVVQQSRQHGKGQNLCWLKFGCANKCTAHLSRASCRVKAHSRAALGLLKATTKAPSVSWHS